MILSGIPAAEKHHMSMCTCRVLVHSLTPRPAARPHPQGIPNLQELKLVYYQHMVRYYLHSHNYLEVTRCYKSMCESPLVSGDATKWQPVRGQLPAHAYAWMLMDAAAAG
jgi:hypothetical protein